MQGTILIFNLKKYLKRQSFANIQLFVPLPTRKTVASNEGAHNSAAGSAADGGAGTSGETAALFSKLRSFSIGSGPNSPQRVVSNLRGYLTHRLSNITPSDTGESYIHTYIAAGCM